MKWLLVLLAFVLSACTTAGQPSAVQTEENSLSPYQFVVLEDPSCTANKELTEQAPVKDEITGIDADGTTLSFWTPSLTGVPLVITEATQMCGTINPEDVTISLPDYRCQVRVDIDMTKYDCRLPQQ